MKSTRYAFGRALALLCTFVFISFGFISCQTETEYETEYVYVYQISDENILTGEWKSSYGEIYKISATALSNSYTYNGETCDAYAGDSLVVRYTNEGQTAG